MRKSVFILIVLAAVLPVFADEYCNLELVDEWECPVEELFTAESSGLDYNDGYLYFAGADHVYIIEPDDSGYLELAATQIDLADDYIGDVVVRNNLAYVSNAYHMLIYDVSDPLNFDSLGSCPVSIVNQIYLMDTLLMAVSHNLHVINIADSTNPTYVRGYSLPWSYHYLPYVSEDIYPYVLVPCRVDVDDPPMHYYDSYINVIDITQTYSYSPFLNSTAEYPNNSLKGIGRVGSYFFGLTHSPIITIYDMDTLFEWTVPKTGWNNSSYAPAIYTKTLNDSIVFLNTENNFYLMSFADTSDLSVIASYKNTDDNAEYYYEAVAVDSFLFVYVNHWEHGYDNTAGILSFKLDFSFTSIHETPKIPTKLSLLTHPNPFNSTLRITAPENATVTIHDTRGRMVADLGTSRLWNPGDDVPSGVYIVRAVVGDVVVDGKAVLIR